LTEEVKTDEHIFTNKGFIGYSTKGHIWNEGKKQNRQGKACYKGDALGFRIDIALENIQFFINDVRQGDPVHVPMLQANIHNLKIVINFGYLGKVKILRETLTYRPSLESIIEAQENKIQNL
jgi:hypothetical protein